MARRKRRKQRPKAKRATVVSKKAIRKGPLRDSKGRFVKAKPVKAKPAKRKAKPVKAKKPAPKPVKRAAKRPAPKPVKRKAKPAVQVRAKRKAPKKPVRRPAKPRTKVVPVNYIEVGDVTDWSTSAHLSTNAQRDHYKNFSHLTRSPIEQDGESKVGLVFKAAMDGHIAKTPLEETDLRIYNYGVLIRPDGGEITPSLVSETAIILKDFHPSITIAYETNGQTAMLITLGSEKKSLSVAGMANRLLDFGTAMQSVYDMLEYELDCDVDWSVFWDTDEMMY